MYIPAMLLAACAGQPVSERGAPLPPAWPERDGAPLEAPFDLHAIPDAVPRPEPRAERGNPPFYEVFGKRYFVMDSAGGHVERGIASWYGAKFHGRPTSSGEPYDMFAMTAAHRRLPLPTFARVTNLENGRSVIVRINDRGPFAHNRVIDLSYAAAVRLDIIERGTGLVEVRTLDPLDPAKPDGTGLPAGGAEPLLFLQVGAFSREENAGNVVARLRGASIYNVSVLSRDDESPRLWRVRIGPLSGVEEVDETSARIGELGFGDARVVIE